MARTTGWQQVSMKGHVEGRKWDVRHALMRLYRVWLWLRDRQNRLWVTPAATGLAAVALAFGANAVGALLPESLPSIKAGTIDNLLEVLATSMLAIAIFCLATLVSALSSSSMTATPRATDLLMGDPGARASIGSFVAAFIFAVVARTALDVGYYDEGGRLVLFACTVLVVMVVVMRLLFWIRAGSTLGRMADTVGRIASVTRRALQEQARNPWMGAGEPPADPAGEPVNAGSSGYLTAINLRGLQQLATEDDLSIHVRVRPGAFVDPQTALALVEGEADATGCEQLRECFVLGPTRTYDQDARFGMIVLGEVALRALSPSINDPGTAIGVMTTMTQLLIEYSTQSGQDTCPAKPCFDRLTAPACEDHELIRDAFMPISRDGARMVEVVIRTQKLLAAIMRNAGQTLGSPARELAVESRDRALAALTHAPDRARLDSLHRRLFGQS